MAKISAPGASLRDFDLNLLRVFDALLAARSVSGAAQRLGLSQPATSAALTRLRAALNDVVLVRNGNRMVPTALAEELHPRVTRILEDVGQALTTSLKLDASTTTRRFRIGASDYAAATMLGPLAQRLLELAPRASVEVLSAEDDPATALATRRVDVILSDGWSVREVRRSHALFRDEFVCVARAGHPRLSRRPTLAEFLEEEHVLISPRGVVPGVLDAALEKIGRKRRIALSVPHYLVAPGIIAHTDLVMTLPRRVVTHSPHAKDLQLFKPPLELAGFDVVMAFDDRSESEPAIQWLMRIVREVGAGRR